MRCLTDGFCVEIFAGSGEIRKRINAVTLRSHIPMELDTEAATRKVPKLLFRLCSLSFVLENCLLKVKRTV